MLDPLREAISLRAAADRDGSLRVTQLAIDEELGLPWRGVVEAVQPAAAAPLDPGALIGEAVAVTLKRTPAAGRTWSGVVMACERLPAGATWRRWQLELAHPLALRGLGRASRLIRDRDAAALVRELLSTRERAVRVDLAAAPPRREQLTQWRESDLAWCLRLLEREGISLVCTGDEALLTDHPRGFPHLDLTLPYRAAAADEAWGIDPARDVAVRCWRHRVAATAHTAAVRDWDWRSPQEPLARSAAAAGPRAAGEAREDGGHHRDAGEARRLAGIGAEALRCAREAWMGEADHPALAAGHVLRLSAPDEPEAEGEWLLTAAHHEAGQAIESGAGTGAGNSYRCAFSAWPADRPWRPSRRTPVPQVPGLIHAVVDGPAAAVYADVDDDGCYRVKPAYDPDGTASMAVRLATPYAGADHGLHLPLHPGTEVLVAHIDGDPDRPVIAAAVPNPTHPSVVVGGNRSQCVLHSAGGNRLVFEDAVGREVWEAVATRDRRARVGGDDDSQVRGNRTAVVAGSDTLAVQGDASSVVGRASSETVTGAKAVTVGGAMQVSVGAALNQTVGGALAEQVGAARVSMVAGDSTTAVGGDHNLTVGKDQQETTAGKRQIRAKKLRLAVQEEFALTCGKASIVLRKNGDIIIQGGAITVKGTGTVVVKGSKLKGN